MVNIDIHLNKHLIFWDIDGTIMHCGSDGTKALNLTFFQLYGIENAFTKVGIGSAMDSVILDRIMNSFDLDPKHLGKVKELYVKNLGEILEANETKRVLPGIPSLLEHIHKSPHHFNALLTSNLRIGAETKLKSVGLDHYFHVGGFGDHIGEKWDAALEGIKEAEDYYQVSFSKNNIYIIGDSTYDIQCAKKLGLKSIAVSTGFVEHELLEQAEPDYLYKDLSDWQELEFIQK
ncbi:MAG: HAD family hydrolase [Anaerovoracaceae bacterium]|jgi:phosphoglycolate phosphatase